LVGTLSASVTEVAADYPGCMRRLLTIVLVIVAVGMVREILLDRSPKRGLHGGDPVIGSLDTWPAVPRRPTE
jgi:hypothetical protein